MFDILRTGIDGLDAILGGGVRYPQDAAAFAFITGGAGSGKTMLALELVARAWLEGQDGSSCLFYTVEQAPEHLHKKLEFDFEYYGHPAEVRALEREVPHKLCLEAKTRKGTTRLVLTQANPANLQKDIGAGPIVDVDWIQAEIGNWRMAAGVHMVAIDNVGLLLTDLDYFGKRTALLETRRTLMQSRIHGIFVHEENDPRDLRIPTAEEFSTDLLIRLAFVEQHESFKARTIEIQKARHQYYYRGQHHFSIAGRGITRDVYLGARNERGPGIHIYPSVPAQLSIARDHARFHVPQRGTDPIDLGHPEINRLFLSGTGPGASSSTVLLAEPGTRYTFLALRQHCLDATYQFQDQFRVLYLHPEFISAGKLLWDIMRTAEGGHRDPTGRPAARLAFDNIHRLGDRFPLITEQRFMIPALLDLLRYRSITPWFVDLAPPGSARGRGDFNPTPYMTTFDNVLHLYLDAEGQEQRPYLRVLKSTGNDFQPTPIALNYRVN